MRLGAGRLCLVPVCPNSVRAAAEDRGAVLAEHDPTLVARAEQTQTAPPAARPAPPRVSLSMDGLLAHIHDVGWKELKAGCIYSTRTRVPRKRPDTVEIRAEHQRDVTALTTAERLGWPLGAEACRRGVPATTEVVVIGDGAHGIWNIASEHFPQATQMVAWDHASQ